MFPLRYGFAWEGCEEQPTLNFPLSALPDFTGTICPSDYLLPICLAPFVARHTAAPHAATEAAGSPQLM